MENECNGEKVGYKSRKLARTALNIIKGTNHNRHTIPIRCYYCTPCNMWHLTSSEEDDGIGGKIRSIQLKHGKEFQQLLKNQEK